jgi:hypothetical protein
MRKDGKQFTAELRGHGEYGWECQFFQDSSFLYGRRWNTRACAESEADEKRQELEANGWTLL